VVEVLTLAAIGLAPPLLLACTAAAIGTWSGAPGAMVASVCVLASGPAQLALYGLAAALLARTGFLAARAAAATRRAWPHGRARAPRPGGCPAGSPRG